jgi:hypothetical protein
MFEYKILNDTQFEIVGPQYRCTFTGDEDKAKEIILSLENPNPISPEPVKGPLSIKISIDKPIIQADGTDTATISITLERDGVPVSDADDIVYFVPVIKIDGTQHSLEQISLSGGKGSIIFKTDTPSIYTARLDMMRPKPTAILQENPEIIAK